MPVPQPAHTHKWVCFICGEPLQIPSYELLVKSAEETPAEVKPVEEKPTVKPETPAEVVPETPAETAIEDVEIIPVIDICEEAGNQATEKGVKVSFGEVEDADFYKLYVKYCGGKKYEVRKITPAELDNIEITSINGKPVNTKKNIHLYVVAYKMVDDKEVKLEKSWHSHIAGIDSEMYTNPVDIILDQTEISTWQGRKIVLKPEVVLADETKSLLTDNHTSVFRYKSSDPSIATVNENGKIRAKAKGTCYIYVATINGLTKKIKLTVKDL